MNAGTATGTAWDRSYRLVAGPDTDFGRMDLRLALGPSFAFHAVLFAALCLIPWHQGALNLEPPRFISIQLDNSPVAQSPVSDALVPSTQPPVDAYTDSASQQSRSTTAMPFKADSDDAAARIIQPHKTNSTQRSIVANERPQPLENAVPHASSASPLPRQDAPREQASAVDVAARVVSGAADSVMAAFSGLGTPLCGSPTTATAGDSSASDRWHAVRAVNNWSMQQGNPVPLSTPGKSSKGYDVNVLVSMQSGVTLEWQDKPDPDAMHEALMNASKCLAVAEQNREADVALNAAGSHGAALSAYESAKKWTEKAIACAPRDNGLPLSNLEFSVAQICLDLGEDHEAVRHALLCTSLRGGTPAAVDAAFQDLVSYADLHKQANFRQYLSALASAYGVKAQGNGAAAPNESF